MDGNKIHFKLSKPIHELQVGTWIENVDKIEFQQRICLQIQSNQIRLETPISSLLVSKIYPGYARKCLSHDLPQNMQRKLLNLLSLPGTGTNVLDEDFSRLSPSSADTSSNYSNPSSGTGVCLSLFTPTHQHTFASLVQNSKSVFSNWLMIPPRLLLARCFGGARFNKFHPGKVPAAVGQMLCSPECLSPF